ncbi:hypothetical protein RDWZM_000473 [Blomia tropicalis]|uniref:Gustatory receptor n=1 Tax=Blomia tropicalis TaxID=40697 RepID=A0A9Q0M8W0_BLOTA|nr:hypothetical protein RDWZM_000473 [Blomia tropicalis]
MALMWNLLCGGIIIRHLHSIGADHIDHNRRFAIHLIVKWFITILIMFQISILICDQYDVKILYRFFFNQTITPFERSRIVKLVISVVRHIHTFFIEISVICLFAYCQEIYSKHIRLMITKQSIDIKRLELIYIRLERLADRYETLNRYYAIPLLLNFAVDIVMMLGCSCYLIIYRPPDEINIQMISLIMAVFLFSIVRLFTCCTVATKVNNSHRMLVRHILETFDHWTIESWQSYNDIVQIEQFDCDYRFIRNQIIQWLIIIIVLNVLGTVVFNMEDLQTLYQLVTFDSINENQRTRMNNTFYVVSLNSIHMIAQASSLLLFAYCQQIYCLKIEKLSNLTLPIDEKRLKHLKSSLMEMTENHQSMIQLFSCSIIVNLCTDMMLFIGNLCYIILHRPNSNNGQVISFVMVGALFSAIRLIISCTLSTKVIETHHYLARSIIERFRNWNLESWQTFNDIVRIGHKFRVSIGFEMFHVEQAAILPIMGFCFNYIVVLLQTENSLF